MSLAKHLAENHRLSILKALSACEEYRANESIIQTICHKYGASISADGVLGHLAWLDEAGLVVMENLSDYTIATLTQRGLEVREGKATHPGVKRPRPGL